VVRRTRLVALLIAATAAMVGSLAFASPASASNHIVRIQNRGNLLCLQPDGASLDAGVSVVQVPCIDSQAQYWEFISLGGTTFQIRNTYSGLCMDAFGGATNGTPVVQWPCANISNQKWDTGKQLPDIVTITSKVAGTSTHCLDVPGAQDTIGLAMQIYRCNGTVAQIFGAGIITIIFT